jgi:enoyl-CoA hydratase/carnithine racemase
VTLSSPHNRNALSSRLLTELLVALREVGADPGVRAVVLTATGSVFCSGADLRERLASSPSDGGDRRPPSLPEVLSCLGDLPQPVVARVNGHVRAGGMGLVAACDLAVAARSATFAFTEVRVGVAPAVIAVPALRVMGRRAFTRYALTGEPFDATAAAAAGLLTAAVDDADLDRWVDTVLAAFSRCSPTALAATKGLVEGLDGQEWETAIASAEALSEEMFASEDAVEGMAAFLEKRDPRWVDR